MSLKFTERMWSDLFDDKHIESWQIPHGLVARISGFHPGGPGSIPGAGEVGFRILNCKYNEKKKQ